MAEVLGVGFASQKAACAAHKANYNTVKDRMRRLSLTFEQALLMNPAVAPIQKKCVAHGVLRWTYWARKRRGWTEEQALGIEGPPRADPKPRLARILRFQYALTIERYEALLAQHDGCCWICLQEANPPCVDHCHRTQKVRGILCRGCNTAIGRMGDDPSLLRAAAAYLER